MEQCRAFVKIKQQFLDGIDHKDPKFGFSLSLEDYALLAVTVFTPQSYGVRLEAMFSSF
jgi:hypothetical protein